MNDERIADRSFTSPFVHRRLGSAPPGVCQRHPPANTPRLGVLARLVRGGSTLWSALAQGLG
jgi:hypothetical protein